MTQYQMNKPTYSNMEEFLPQPNASSTQPDGPVDSGAPGSAPCDPLWECHGAPFETCDYATSSQPCLVDGSVSDWPCLGGAENAAQCGSRHASHAISARSYQDPLHAPRDPEVFGVSATSVAPLSYSEHSPCNATDGGLL